MLSVVYGVKWFWKFSEYALSDEAQGVLGAVKKHK